MISSSRRPGAITIAIVVALMACLWLAAGAFDAALAQAGPFGVPRGRVVPEAGGFVGWLLAKQSEFYRAMSATIRAAKTDGTALVTLLGISFGYGIFHAAGPGHGKAVISSYLVANEETWRRGITLSFASALLQAMTAVLIVAIAALLLGATAKIMGDAVRWIEIASYALITALGARLLWVKGRGFLTALHERGHSKPGDTKADSKSADAAHAHRHHRDHHSHPHDHAHHDHADQDSVWGHAHGPEPAELAGPGGWRRGLSAIVAVGLRPCSGAILVLVFSLAQGLFWAGIAATFVMGLGTAITVAVIATLAVGAKSLARRFTRQRAGWGTLAMRGIEVGASALVLVFGLALLAGYMATERIAGV